METKNCRLFESLGTIYLSDVRESIIADARIQAPQI
jgi:hypothetical protein